jgi:hypothetical protein
MEPIEEKIIERLVTRALSLNYTISVNDGEEWTVKRSTDQHTIMHALATTGEDILRFDMHGKSAGVVQLIYHGDETVICDHSDNEAINALVEYADQASEEEV